jgi:hypothetical protein
MKKKEGGSAALYRGFAKGRKAASAGVCKQ